MSVNRTATVLPPTPANHGLDAAASSASIFLREHVAPERLMGGIRHPDLDDPEDAIAIFEGLELYEHNDSAGRYVTFPICDPADVKALWDFLREEGQYGLPLGAA